MARNIWDVSDILLRQRAGDIYGNMFANLGQQVGGAIQQYGQNKQMASMGVADFEAAAQANPELLQSLERDQNVSKEVKSAFNKLKSGGVGVRDASILSTYAKSFVTNKAQAIQQQADAMKIAEFQRMQQERARMGELFGAMGQMETQAPSFYPQAAPQTSTLLDRPGMREQATRALQSPTVRAARDLYSVMPSAVTPETLGSFAVKQFELGKEPTGQIVDSDYLDQRKKAGYDVTAVPFGRDSSGKMQYIITKESPFSPQSPTIINTGDSQLDRQIYENLAKNRESAVVALNTLPAFSEAIKLLEEGDVITGTAAETRLAFAKALSLFGVDDPSIENTEVLRSRIAVPVFNLVRNLGSGTAISDKDREFAEKAAGGNISLDRKSILRLVEIGKRAGQSTVDEYKQTVDRVYPEENQQFGRARASLLLPQPIRTPTGSQPTPTPTGAFPGAPQVGTVVSGYRFKGGNPNDEKNWEKVP